MLERCEERVVLNADALPNETFGTDDDPLDVEIAYLNGDQLADVVTFNRGGTATVAFNNGDDSWADVFTVDLGVGPINGGAAFLAGSSPFAKLAVQGDDSVFVFDNDGEGNFSLLQTITPGNAGDLSPAVGETEPMATGFFNNDFHSDLVILSPQTNEVLVLPGSFSGGFGSAERFSTGGVMATSLVVGNFIGNENVDVAVGHADGTLTLLEGVGDGQLTLRNDLTVTGLGSIVELAAADFDDDGDMDIVVSGSNPTVLLNDNDASTTSPIINGDFSAGLTGWETTGNVNGLSGFAQLNETEQTFLTTIQQAFVVPDDPQELSFDLRAIGFDVTQPNRMPDFFEASLLDSNFQSVVPTHANFATSFFNINPESVVSLGSATTFDGTTITLDITGLTAGQEVTLYIDLGGNPPESGSVAVVDNVQISPDVVRTETFTLIPLTGPFSSPAGVAVGDVDGVGGTDIIIADRGANALLIFNNDGSANFSRMEFDTSGFGNEPLAVTAGPLTAGDSIDDIAATLFGSNQALTPLTFFAPHVNPVASLQADEGQAISVTTTFEDFDDPNGHTATITFGDEVVNANVDEQTNTVSANYTFADNGVYDIVIEVFDSQGNSISTSSTASIDNVAPTIAPIGPFVIDEGDNLAVLTTFTDPGFGPSETWSAQIQWEAGVVENASVNVITPGSEGQSSIGELGGSYTYENEGVYDVILTVTDDDGGQATYSTTVTVENQAPINVQADDVTGDEGSPIEVVATFEDDVNDTHTVTIDFGDGTVVDAVVDEMNGSGWASATHFYADDGIYTVTIIVTDDSGDSASTTATAIIDDVPATISPIGPFTVDEGDDVVFSTEISDPSFGGSETWTAQVEWEPGVVENVPVTIVTPGEPGQPTVAEINGSYTYENEGDYTLILTVTDNQGNDSVFTTTVTVENEAPVIVQANDVAGDEGSSVEATVEFADGIFDTHTVTIDFGDGTVVNVPVDEMNGSGSATASHTYGDNGNYTITYYVTDDSGATTQATVNATIGNVAPTVTAIGNLEVETGQILDLDVATFTDPGFDTASTQEDFVATIDWGAGVTVGEVSETPGGEGVLTQGTVSGQFTYAMAGMYTVTVTVQDDDGGTSSASFEITVVDSDQSVCLPTLDFENDPYGNSLQAGGIVAEQWADWGIHITTHDPDSNPAMIFDSANPTGDDNDLGTPNEDFGGPGQGHGGGQGQAGENHVPLNNVLIISEDNHSNDDDDDHHHSFFSWFWGHYHKKKGHHGDDHDSGPDDNADGGTIIFTFDHEVMVDELHLLDIDGNETGGTIELFDALGNVILSTAIPSYGDNSFQVVELDAEGVRRMEVTFVGSGAITDVIFCEDVGAGDVVSVGGSGQAAEGSEYELTLDDGGRSLASWTINWGDGTVETVAGSEEFATHAYADGDNEYEISAWATDGSNVYLSNSHQVQISNVAPDLIISGSATVETGEEYVLDLSSFDPGEDTIYEWQIDWGDGEIEVVAGNPSSVTHVYEIDPQTVTIQATAFDEDSPAEQVYVENDGLVVIEAENYTSQHEGRGSASDSEWVTVHDSRVGGDAYVKASPDDGVNVGDTTKGPRLDYEIEFSETGTYYAWVLMNGRDSNDDSVHLGLNGTPASYGNNGISNDRGDWKWENEVDGRPGYDVVRIEVTEPGTHVLNLWMREDGVKVDRLLLTTDPHFQPSGLGPDETHALTGGYTSNTLNVEVVPASHVSIPDIDFETDASGNALSAGDDVSEAWADWGVHITTHDPHRYPPMIFDSSNPTGGDYDLGTTNRDFGGPGRGYGGEAGRPGENNIAQNNILIISEDGHSHDPDDRAKGGTLIFTFDQAVRLDELHVLDVEKAERGSRVKLYDAQGNLIKTVDMQDVGNNGFQTVELDAEGVRRMEVIFKGSGAITNVVFGEGDDVLPQPQLLALPTIVALEVEGAIPISLDEEVSGSVANTTERAYYELTLTQTERVFFDILAGQDFNFSIFALYDSIGNELFNHGIVDNDVLELGPDTYILEFGSLVGSKSFTFVLRDVPDIVTTPILVDQVTNGSIDSPGEVDHFTFAGTAGDQLFFDVLSAPSARFSIIAPSGAEVMPFDDADFDTFTLSETGTYTVIADSEAGANVMDDTGPYQFEIVSVPPTVAQPINIGDVIDEAIDVRGEMDEYTFTGIAGDRLFFDVQLAGNFRFKIDGPIGEEIMPFDDDDFDVFTLTRSGTYTITVDSELGSAIDDTGSYRFQVVAVPDTSNAAIELGRLVDGFVIPAQTVTQTLTASGQEFIYTFEANAGEEITFDFLANSNAAFELYSPTGELLVPLSRDDVESLILTESGTYTLVLGDRGAIDDLASYSFEVWVVPQTNALTNVRNRLITSTVLTPGHAVTATFDAQAGEEFYFDFKDTDNNIRFNLEGPTGNTIFSNQNSNRFETLTQDGQYTLTVQSRGNSRSFGDTYGPVQFQVQQVTPAADTVRDTKGTDYWIGVPNVEIGSIFGSPPIEATVSISSLVDTSGMLMIPGTNTYQAFEVAAGQTITLEVPVISDSNIVSRRGIHITTQDPVSVQATARRPVSTDSFLALPVNMLGNEYVVAGWGDQFLQGIVNPHFSVVATQDNTTVTITPAIDLSDDYPAGVPFQVVLDADEVFRLETDDGADTTGTIVQADQPIAVYGGHELTQIPQGFIASDYIVDQLPSTDTWGSQFFSVPLATRDGDTFRMVSATDGTEVNINGTLVATLDRGEFYETVLTDASEMTSTQPMMVVQYSNSSSFDNAVGDPMMMIVPPASQFDTQYIFTTPPVEDFNHYINIIAPDSAIGQITLDGATIAAGSFSSIGTSGYSSAQLLIDEATHTLSGAEGFAAWSYGFSSFDSYGHPLGWTVDPATPPAPPTTYANFDDVTAAGQLYFTAATYNRGTGNLHADVVVENLGDDTLRGPVLGVIDPIMPGTVEFANPDGTEDSNRPFVSFDDELIDGELLSGQTSTSSAIVFSNALKERFSFDVELLAPGNSAPTFVSLPNTNASAGFNYTYQALADDLDGDEITYRLVVAPDNMTIDAQTGLVEWLAIPVVDQGIHNIQIEARDNYGGVATQTFELFVDDGFARNTAVSFVSDPVLYATVDEVYQYDSDAIDAGNSGASFIYTLDVGFPAGMSIDVNTGEVFWTPDAGDLGTHEIGITATSQASGRMAHQTYILEVRPTNTAPVFTSTPPTDFIQAGEIFRYDANAFDAEDGFKFSLAEAPNGLTINPNTGMLLWQTDGTSMGPHVVTVQVTDDRGLFDLQTFAIQVIADTEAPDVAIQMTQDFLVIEATDIGQTVNIEVAASDNVAIDTLTLSQDGTPVLLGPGNTYQFTPDEAGFVTFTATATDTSGNISTTSTRLRVLDPTDTEAPFVQITAPLDGTTITYLTDILGTVTDANLDFYELQYSRNGANFWTTFATGNTEVTADYLGTFDPTMLLNDDYNIRIYAIDVNGQSAISEPITVGITAQAKLGQFTLEFSDLSVPLAGIPIEVIRQYDTRRAQDSGDFGYGWTLGFREANIRETVPQNPLEELVGLFATNAFEEGTRVYLNSPDGRRLGFTFKPELVVESQGAFSISYYIPKFEADPGVFETLTVEEIALQKNPDGRFTLYAGGVGLFNYNPHEYTLTTKDGIAYTYDQFEGLQTIEDRNGVTLTFSEDGIVSSTGQSIDFIRDDFGRITEIIDPVGNSLLYTYDVHGDLVGYTDQEGSTALYTYYTDPAHYLESATDQCGCTPVIRTEYDDDGRISGTYDADGNLVQTYQYDLPGFTETFVDGLGNPTTITYDERGNVLSETDALGYTQSWTYDDDDNEITYTNQRDYTWSYTYDTLGNMLTMTDPLDGLGTGGTTTYTYNEFSQQTSMLDALNQLTQWVYDDSGNLLQEIDAAGYFAEHTYDELGRRISSTDQEHKTTTYSYAADYIHTPTTITNADDSQIFNNIYILSGTPAAIQDEVGNITRTYINNVGLTTRIVDAEDGETIFEYDDAYRLVSVTDPVDNFTQFVYDNKGQMIEEIDPLGNSINYVYDILGRKIEHTDAEGRKIRYTYDTLGQMIYERWYDANGALVHTSEYEYDGAGNMISATEPDSQYVMAYDALNRLTEIDNAGTPDTPYLELTHTHDVVGNLLTTTDNHGVSVVFTYSSRNLLKSQTWTGAEVDPLHVEYDYNGRGQETEVRRYNDTFGTNLVLRTVSEFDNRGRITDLTHLNALDEVLADYDYVWDAASRLISETHHSNTTDYTYDNINQLVDAQYTDSNSPAESFDWDAGGNPKGPEYTIGDDNQILEDADFTYQYDLVGNLQRKTSKSDGSYIIYDYDHNNQLLLLTNYTSGGIIANSSEYTYDVFGKRIAKNVDLDGNGLFDTQERFGYFGDNIWLDAEQSGLITARYLTSIGIDELVARHRNEEGTVFYLTDHQESVRDLVSLSGEIVNHIDYRAFGSVSNQTNPEFGDRFLFQSREFDSSTGQYYFRLRYYSPHLKRFTTQDPFSTKGKASFAANVPHAMDINPYSFAMNNPVIYRDPTGLIAMTERFAQEEKRRLCVILWRDGRPIGSPLPGEVIFVSVVSSLAQCMGKGRHVHRSMANAALVVGKNPFALRMSVFTSVIYNGQVVARLRGPFVGFG